MMIHFTVTVGTIYIFCDGTDVNCQIYGWDSDLR